MNKVQNKRIVFPGVGMRMIKSAIGVYLGFVIYYLRGMKGAPFYTALSVLWCMRASRTEMKGMSIQRTIGTFIGGFYGLLMILMEKQGWFGTSEMFRLLAISIMLIPVLYTTVLFNRKNTSYFTCVVFLSIVVLHLEDTNPYVFVWNRMLDTLIGIGVCLLLNMEFIPRKRCKDTLFVSGIDQTLLSENGTLTPFSKVELNRMLDEGMLFTVSTMRTPASIMESIGDVHLKLPVITMDGAVLQDLSEKRCLKKYTIEQETAIQLYTLIQEEGMHVFTNCMLEDIWTIFYGEFKNTVEEDIYKKLRKSPHRNYIHNKYLQFVDVVYFMVVDQKEKIEKLYEVLENRGYTETQKILMYDSTNYPGYAYIKIYNSNATKQNMICYLQEYLQVEKVITFGSMDGEYDVVVKNGDSNKVVKELRKLYEPYYIGWNRAKME